MDRLSMAAANQSLRYNTTQDLIGLAHTQNDPYNASTCIVVEYNVCTILITADWWPLGFDIKMTSKHFLMPETCFSPKN